MPVCGIRVVYNAACVHRTVSSGRRAWDQIHSGNIISAFAHGLLGASASAAWKWAAAATICAAGKAHCCLWRHCRMHTARQRSCQVKRQWPALEGKRQVCMACLTQLVTVIVETSRSGHRPHRWAPWPSAWPRAPRLACRHCTPTRVSSRSAMRHRVRLWLSAMRHMGYRLCAATQHYQHMTSSSSSERGTPRVCAGTANGNSHHDKAPMLDWECSFVRGGASRMPLNELGATARRASEPRPTTRGSVLLF